MILLILSAPLLKGIPQLDEVRTVNRVSRRRWVYSTTVVALVAALVVSLTAEAQQSLQSPVSQLLAAPRDSGLNVAPVYEGWEPNADGTVRLYFGYMNRNWKEELDVPIGVANFFEPGLADRGQPTHFLPRRHKQVFSVVVPGDFSGPLVWTLSIHDVTERVTASLALTQRISASKDPSTSNAPPRITVPTSQTITLPQPAVLSVAVTDDGLPKPQIAGSGAPGAEVQSSTAQGLSVRWAKYRGPGQVTLATPTAVVEGGKVATATTFTEPGLYVIQVTAYDGSLAATSDGSSIPGFACCWANELIMITVKPAQTPGSR